MNLCTLKANPAILIPSLNSTHSFTSFPQSLLSTTSNSLAKLTSRYRTPNFPFFPASSFNYMCPTHKIGEQNVPTIVSVTACSSGGAKEPIRFSNGSMLVIAAFKDHRTEFLHDQLGIQQRYGLRFLNGVLHSTDSLGLGRLCWQPGMVVLAFVRHN